MKTEQQKGKHHSEHPTSSSSSSSSHNKVPTEQKEMDGKAVDPHLDKYIVPKVQCKLACRKCQAVFTKEEAAMTHLKSNCFFGQSVANLQEMLLRVPGGVGAGAGSLYDCLACDTTLDGEKALSQHLESALHKHRTIKRSARNAKEHATSLLPHSSACFPNPNTASTSQSATHPISSPPPPPTTSAAMPSSAVSSFLCCSSSSSSTTPHNTTAAGKSMAPGPFLQSFSWEAQCQSLLFFLLFSSSVLTFNGYLKFIEHLRSSDLDTNRRLYWRVWLWQQSEVSRQAGHNGGGAAAAWLCQRQ